MKIVVPVIKLQFVREDAYPLDLFDIFEQSGCWNPQEDYTFTGRLSLDPEDPDTPAIKAQVAARIREVLAPEEAERILALLNQHNWDVSFYVDTF